MRYPDICFIRFQRQKTNVPTNLIFLFIIQRTPWREDMRRPWHAIGQISITSVKEMRLWAWNTLPGYKKGPWKLGWNSEISYILRLFNDHDITAYYRKPKTEEFLWCDGTAMAAASPIWWAYSSLWRNAILSTSTHSGTRVSPWRVGCLSTLWRHSTNDNLTLLVDSYASDKDAVRR